MILCAKVVRLTEAAWRPQCKVCCRLDLPFLSCRDENRSLHKSREDAAPQTSDLVDIAPFLRTGAHNLVGLQPTVLEQIGQSTLAIVRKHRSDGLPDAEARALIFHLWLSQFTWLWQRHFSWSRVGP